MPANYVYKTVFYTPDPEYIVTSNFQVLPHGITFHDYDKFIREQPSDKGHFIDQQERNSGKLSFSVYHNAHGHEYLPENSRVCDPSCSTTMAFSKCCTRLAICRKDKVPVRKGSKAPKDKYVIDIFDSSKIDFFMDESILTPEDPRLLMTIVDDDLPKGPKI